MVKSFWSSRDISQRIALHSWETCKATTSRVVPPYGPPPPRFVMLHVPARKGGGGCHTGADTRRLSHNQTNQQNPSSFYLLQKFPFLFLASTRRPSMRFYPVLHSSRTGSRYRAAHFPHLARIPGASYPERMRNTRRKHVVFGCPTIRSCEDSKAGATTLCS